MNVFFILSFLENQFGVAPVSDAFIINHAPGRLSLTGLKFSKPERPKGNPFYTTSTFTDFYIYLSDITDTDPAMPFWINTF